FKLAYIQLRREAIIGLIVIFALAASLAYPLFNALGKPIYLAHVEVFWLLLGACFAYGVSLIAHYALYARGEDRMLLWASLSAVPFFLILVLLIATHEPLLSVPIGLLGAYVLLALVKFRM